MSTQKFLKRNGKWRIGAVAVALLLALSLVAGLLLQTPESNLVNAAGALSDADTSQSYSSSLGNGTSTQNDGRIWTDKTVTPARGEEDFLVTYSALATSTSVISQSNAPLDVVFIIDNSSSMVNDHNSALTDTVKAVNESIAALMEMNPQNRIAVTLYGAESDILLPLGHYTSSSRDNTYIKINRVNSEDSSFSSTVREGNYRVTQNSSNGRGTNIQLGVYTGMKILAEEQSTTVEINGAEVSRIPAVILLSDGAATYSSTGRNWWQPTNSSQGPGSAPYYGNGMLAMATASYMKQQITDNYANGDQSAPNAAKVYTVGMGFNKLSQSNGERDLAYLTLNPSRAGYYWWTNMGRSINNAFTQYRNRNSVNINVGATNGWNYYDRYYSMTHPTSGDITSLNYNDRYYDSIGGEDISEIFQDIVDQISSTAKYPTQVTGDPLSDGYLTYVDEIGQYMTVSSVKSIEYGGEVFDQVTAGTPVENQDGSTTTTYTFSNRYHQDEEEVTIDGSIYGPLNIDNILVTVTKAADGTETVEVKIPAAAIPVRINTITLDGEGKVTDNQVSDTSPIKVNYGVSLNVNEATLEGVSSEYLAANTDENGNILFYSNAYSGQAAGENGTRGDTYVTYTPAEDNAFYYVQENTPLYTDQGLNTPATAIDPSQTYYYSVSYYDGNTVSTAVLSRSGSSLNGCTTTENGQVYLNAGTLRWDDPAEFATEKTNSDTDTATYVTYPTYVPAQGETSGYYQTYLGNNGVLPVKAPASLIISKTVTTQEGITAPDATFTFKVTVDNMAGQTISGILSQNGQADQAASYTFAQDNTITVTLKAGQSVELFGLQGKAYTVEEVNIPENFTPEQNPMTGTIGGVCAADAQANFVNTFTPEEIIIPGGDGEPGEAALTVTKVLEGRDWKDGDSFTFTLAPSNDAAKAAVQNGSIVMENASIEITNADADKSASFGDITFKTTGTFQFTVTETQGSLGGVDYDTTPRTVTVVIGQDTEGNLVVNSITGQDKLTFTNVYTPEEVVVDGKDGNAAIQVEKVLTGREWKAGDSFTFTITPLDGAPAPAANTVTITDQTANHAAIFDAITFDKVGSYQYTIQEVIPENVSNGITYDSNLITATVTVTDPGDGKLAAAVSYSNGKNAAIFTNNYKPEEVIIGGDGEDAVSGLEVQKIFVGRDWTDDDTFTFTLTAVTKDAPMPADNTVTIGKPATGNANNAFFGEMTYTEVGEYVYTITEKKGSLGGVSYSEDVVTVTVTITDPGDGKLEAQVSYDNGKDAAAFTNTYSATGFVGVPTNFNLTKVLEGKDWNGDSFQFELTAVTAGAPMPASNVVTVNQSNAASFNFGDITYSNPGTYEYEVKEIAGTNAGMTYSNNVAKIVVTVRDGLDGKMYATAQVTNGTFTNTYSSEVDYVAAGGANIVKELAGHDLAAGQFTFTVTPKDDASAAVAGINGSKEITTTAASMINGTAKATMPIFSELTFDQNDAGTYTYTISETKGGGAGYTNDTTVYTMTITVADDGNGTLTVTTAVNDGTNTTTYTYTNNDQTQADVPTITFRNSYAASGELGGNGNVSLQATKTLTGRPMTAEEFTFHVVNADNAVVSTGTNAAANDGEAANITFTPIRYTTNSLLADAASGVATSTVNQDGNYVYTYVYTVSESDDMDAGVSVVAGSFQVTVTVTDQGDGTLDIQVSYPESGLKFVNTYGANAQASIDVNGSKVLAAQEGANAPDITGKFTFTIQGSEGAPMPENTTAINDAAGNVDFGSITYTMENTFGTSDVQTMSETRSKTFTYTVTESGSVAGVVNDQTSKTFTVTVTDNGDGTLTATANPATGAFFTFTNTYQVEDLTASISDQISLNKTLDGRDLVEGEFAFQMTDAQGNVVSTGSNGANGNVVMSGITFTQPGVYNYTLSEVNNGLGGVSYDSAAYQVTATVSDQGNGTMAVEWAVLDGDGNQVTNGVSFQNTYRVTSTSVSFDAVKKLEGRDLTAGEFSFELKDENGQVIATAVNDANGTIRFEGLTFTQTGEYVYTLSEVQGNDATVTYDETVYTITVQVTDDGQGNLVATLNTGDSDLIFSNHYAPADPTPAPETSDTAPMMVLGSVMLLAVLVAAGAVVARKRTRR